MLFAILFNLGGYGLFFKYMIDRSDSRIVDRINRNHYRASELVEVKIPVNLPTLQDWTEYEVVSGQVQFKNNKYNYAQIKMTRDTLYLLVIPNHDRSKLVNANIIYAKQVNDIPVNKKSHLPLIKKSISESEYNYTTIRFNAFAPVEDTKTGFDYAFFNIVKTALDVPVQPPEVSTLLS